MNPDYQQLVQRVEELEQRVAKFDRLDRFLIGKDIQFEPSRKFVPRNAKITDATTAGGSYDQTVAQTAVTAINAIIDVLEDMGLSKTA